MKTDLIWPVSTLLTTSEVKSSTLAATANLTPIVDIGDTVGSLRVTGTPSTSTAAYKIVLYLANDKGIWEPQTVEDTAGGTKSGSDDTVSVYRLVHSMPQTIVAGFTVPTFGYKQVQIGIWGAAGDAVGVYVTKLNRSPNA